MTPEQELKAKLEANKADLEAVTANKEKLEKELAELEAAKKPKHGDYGIDHEGDPTIVLEKNESDDLMTACMVEGGGLQCQGVAEEEWLPKTTYGNLVDDLKALQEDVTEFEIEEYKDDLLNINPFIVADQEHEGFIEIKDLSDNQKVHVAYADLPRLYNGLRAIEATIKRNQ
jgi:hypothetical protein